MISQITCFVLNASLKMSNVILGIESLSPVLLVLCYICNKCLALGDSRMEFISLESVLVSMVSEVIAAGLICSRKYSKYSSMGQRKGRKDDLKSA